MLKRLEPCFFHKFPIKIKVSFLTKGGSMAIFNIIQVLGALEPTSHL